MDLLQTESCKIQHANHSYNRKIHNRVKPMAFCGSLIWWFWFLFSCILVPHIIPPNFHLYHGVKLKRHTIPDIHSIKTVVQIGLQPWTSIFQFRRTKSRIRFDNTFWFISLLSTTKKSFPKSTCTIAFSYGICTCSWETTTKIAPSHTMLALIAGNSNGNLNYCIVSFIECGPGSLVRIQKSSLSLHN